MAGTGEVHHDVVLADSSFESQSAALMIVPCKIGVVEVLPHQHFAVSHMNRNIGGPPGYSYRTRKPRSDVVG